MAKIEVKDLNVDLKEIMKKDPQILNKIRGGAPASNVARAMLEVASAMSTGSSAYSKTCPGKDTMYCCTGTDSGCEPGQDTMYCSTKGKDCYFTY
jgi:hypothetical protein